MGANVTGDIPPLPPGFSLDAPAAPTAAPQAAAAPPLPPGFTLDAPAAPAPPISGAPANYQPTGSTAPEPNADLDATRSVTQGATGFNEGIARSILRPLDVVPYLASKAMGGEGVHPFEGTFREHFVDPMGTPQNRVEQALRAGGEMAGENLPLMATGAGVAGSGIRSGVTMAEQAAPGVVNKIRGAADTVLEGMAAHPVASAVGENVGAVEAGAGGNIGRNVSKDSGGDERAQQSAELAGQLALPSTAALFSKFGLTALAVKGAKYAGGKVLDNLPEAALPEQLRPANTYAERKADQNAYSNREGKYEDPNVPAPNPGNFATRRMDAGQAKREATATGAASKEFNDIIAQPDAAANLAEAQRLEETIPGFKPGVAKATQDPALLKLQDSMESRATGDELRQVQQNADSSTKAIRDYKENIIPSQGENPQDVVAKANAARVGGVNKEIDAQKGEVGQQIEQRTGATQQRLAADRDATQASLDERQTAAQQRAAQEQEQARGQVRNISESLPETDPTVVGNELRETRAGLRRDADQRMSELRRNVDPTGRAVVELAPATPDGEPVRMSVNAALNRRAQINQDLADHYGATNRDQAAVRAIRQLQEEKNALDAGIETASGGDEGLRAYNDYYRDEYAPRFLQGASREVGRFNRNGYEGNRVAAEDVPGEFFKPNNISEARQFNRLYGENPEVRERMTDFALDDLRRSAIDPNSGMLKEGAVNKWLAKNERVLNEMPWIRDAVTGRNPDAHYQQAAAAGERGKLAANPKTLAQVDPEAAPLQSKLGQIGEQQRLASNPKTIGQIEPDVDALQKRFGQLEQRQRAVADTKVAKLFNQGKNPEQHIDAALNDWQVMKGLRNSVRGDPQAEMALRKAVINRAPDPMNVEKFGAWLDGNDRALRQVLDPTHLKALRDVLSAAKINNTLPRPTGTVDLPGSLADKGAKVFGITLPSVLQRVLSVKQGRMSAEYGVADVGVRAVRAFTNREIEAAWKEALYNPKVAKDLQMAVKGGMTKPKLAMMRNYMLSVGLHDSEEPKSLDSRDEN